MLKPLRRNLHRSDRDRMSRPAAVALWLRFVNRCVAIAENRVWGAPLRCKYKTAP
ncbi:hypothetical protein KCP73_24255 [Salmonella enterica subsp. enterica]|nr:hypothetical protein KCP73_24255 [Salmonella enterica subsp. enterica]